MYKRFALIVMFSMYPCIAMQQRIELSKLAVEKLLSNDVEALLYHATLIALPIGEYSKSTKNVVIIPKISLQHRPTGFAIIKTKLKKNSINRNHIEFYMEYTLSDGSIVKERHTDIIALPENNYSIAVQLNNEMIKDYPDLKIYSGEEFDDFLQSLIDESQDVQNLLEIK